MEKVLYLTLIKKWFIEILKGIKKTEYREIKPYWTKRLFNSDGLPKKYDSIIFRNGYSKGAPKMKVEFLGVIKKDKYEIILGKILELHNVKSLLNQQSQN
jgi:hypothetical protein